MTPQTPLAEKITTVLSHYDVAVFLPKDVQQFIKEVLEEIDNYFEDLTMYKGNKVKKVINQLIKDKAGKEMGE